MGTAMMDEKQMMPVGGEQMAAPRQRRRSRPNLSLGGLNRGGVLAGLLITFSLFALWRFDIAGLIFQNGASRESSRLERGPSSSWRWSKVSSSKVLRWQPCYQKFDCAKLDVPLDWLDPSDHARASIALIRYNATDRKNYKGSVIINPGGPGGSGIFFVKNFAEHYQTVAGRNYDIVSFDPRGVGATNPQISCLGSPQSNLLWSLQSLPVLDAHPGILYDIYARSYAYSQACSSTIDNNSTRSGQFVSTASTARDMLEITHRLGEDKIRYWGFSYGSFLGVTFASLYPDKIERMILDGNVDAVEYSHASGTHFLEDTDKVWGSFFTFCHAAGPLKCALHASSPSKIEDRVNALLEDIKLHPVIVPGLAPGARPEIVSYSTVRRVISSALYRPIGKYPPLATALAELELGNGRPFLALSGQSFEESLICSSGDGDGDGDASEPYEASEDASNAILCSDNGGWAENATVDDFGRFLKGAEEKSKSAGATMASIPIACVGWNVRAKWRYHGPFKGNTSHPILFIANRGDNITPLISAQRNAAGFPGSEIILQNAYGHTSLAAPSRCVARSTRTYFQIGSLPAPGTVCEADVHPFEDGREFSSSSGSSSSSSSGEMEMETGMDRDRDMDIALWELMMAPVIG